MGCVGYVRHREEEEEEQAWQLVDSLEMKANYYCVWSHRSLPIFFFCTSSLILLSVRRL